MTKTVLVRHGDDEYLLSEALVPTESELHDAFEHHPELFPAEELGLAGP